MEDRLIVILNKIVGHVEAKFLKKAKSVDGSSNIDAPEKIMSISREKYIMAKVVERISEIDTITSSSGSARHAHLKVNDIVGLMVLLDEAISNNKSLYRDTKEVSLEENIKKGNYRIEDDDGEVD